MFFLMFLGLIGVLVFGVMTIFSVIKKNEKAKRNSIIAVVCSILFFVGVTNLESEEAATTPQEDGILVNEVIENWSLGNETFDGYGLELGEFNDENLASIGDSGSILMDMNQTDNVVESIQVIIRHGYAQENLDEIVVLLGVLITSLDNELTVSLDDIDAMEEWISHQEDQTVGGHRISFDGDLTETFYIFAYPNYSN